MENFECYTLAVYRHLGEALNDKSDEDYNEDSPVNGTEKLANSSINNNNEANTFAPYLRLLDKRYLAFVLGRQNIEDDDITKKYDNIPINFKCKCLPACNSINYLADYRTSSLYYASYEGLPLG